MDQYRTFYESVGQKYPEQDTVYQTLKGKLRKKFVLKYISQWQGKFLDIGCNQGIYLLGYQGGWKMGVDISLHVLQKLKHRFQDINLAVSDAQALDCLQSNTFNGILCSEVLEHVYEPEKMIAEIARLLVPGGKALITTPNYKKKRPEWTETGVLRQYGIQGVQSDTYFHTAYQPEELAEMGKTAGLCMLESGTLEKEIKYAAKVPAVIFIIGRWLNRQVFRSEWLERFNQNLFNRFTIWIYHLARLTGLDFLLKHFILRGVRSYILLQKPKS